MQLYKNLQKQISESVRRARSEKRLSRQQVADGARVSLQFLFKLENGNGVSLKQICAVAEFLGMKPSDLLCENLEMDSRDETIIDEVFA